MSFPRFGGKHKVGTTVLEIPLDHPRSFGTAHLSATPSQPALLHSTTLIQLYYPRSASALTTKLDWLERPLATTIAGYAKFTGKSKWLLFPVFWLLAGRVKVEALVDAELFWERKKSAPGDGDGEEEMRQVGNNSSATIVAGEDVADGPFPLVVFSHGLGGNRTTYSQICCEIASRGYIVAAIESRDGSSPTTTVHGPTGEVERIVQYYKQEDLLYLPPNPILTSIGFRKEELLMRLDEVKETLSILSKINSGEGSTIAAVNVRRNFSKPASSWYNFIEWEGRIDLEKDVTMAGHSFGGATTLQVLRSSPSIYPFVRGLAFDPWVDPIPPFTPPSSTTTSSSSSTSPTTPAPEQVAGSSPDKVATEITVPLLVINSEAFTLWQEHFTVLRDIVDGVKKDAKSWLLTLVGSIHLSFSDLPVLRPFIARKSGARVDALEANRVFVEASMEFLKENFKKGGILGKPVAREEDRDGAREVEKLNKKMEPVGEIRVHVASS